MQVIEFLHFIVLFSLTWENSVSATVLLGLFFKAFHIHMFSMWVHCGHLFALHVNRGGTDQAPLAKTSITDRMRVKEILAHRMRAKEIWSCWPMAKMLPKKQLCHRWDRFYAGLEPYLEVLESRYPQGKSSKKPPHHRRWYPLYALSLGQNRDQGKFSLPRNLPPCCWIYPQGISCKKPQHRDPFDAASLGQNRDQDKCS